MRRQPVDDPNNPVADLAELGLGKPPRGAGGRSKADARGDGGLFGIKRNAVLVAGDMRPAQGLFGGIALHALGAQIDQHQVGVSAARHGAKPALHQLIRQRLRIADHLGLIDLEIRTQRLAKSHGLGRDHMHQRAALDAGEDRRIDLLRNRLVIGQNHAAARTAQGLVSGRGRHMGMREGRRIEARRDESRKMRHIHQQIGPDLVGNGPHAREVEDARNGRTARDDHRRLVFQRQRLNLVIVGQQRVLPHAILHGVEPFAGLVRGRAMGQVTAGIKTHAQDGIARLDQRLEHALVCLAARVRLHIGVGHTEQVTGAFDGQIFRHIDKLTAAVVALARIAFGIFVGHHRPLGFHHRAADDVL